MAKLIASFRLQRLEAKAGIETLNEQFQLKEIFFNFLFFLKFSAVVREMKSHPANIPYFPSPNTPWPAIGLPSATAPPNTLPMSPSSHADLYPRQPLATKNPEALWMNNNFPPFSHSYLNPHHHATGTPTGGNGAPVHWTTVGTSPFRPVYPQPYPNHHQHHPCLSPPPFAHLYPALQNRLQNLTYPLKPTTPVKPPSATTPFDIDTILGRHNCNKKLVTFDLDDSMKTSEEDEPMEVVASSGKRRESLKNVIKRKLGGAGKTPCRYPCPECKKSYSTLSGLVKHQESHCPALHRLAHRCKFCDKVYSQQGALKMHMKTHTLPNQCTACGKRFSRPWLLQGMIFLPRVTVDFSTKKTLIFYQKTLDFPTKKSLDFSIKKTLIFLLKNTGFFYQKKHCIYLWKKHWIFLPKRTLDFSTKKALNFSTEKH